MIHDPEHYTVRVLEVRPSGHGACVVKMERPALLRFSPGHHIRVGNPDGDNREYSIYSAPSDETLEILVRIVAEGTISPWLHAREPGDMLSITGPMGEFLLPETPTDHTYLFIATGTGIAPFRSMLRAYPQLDYQLIHGMRSRADRQVEPIGVPTRTTLCISREPPPPGAVAGRVTDALRAAPPPPTTQCYLCGSCDMIYDAMAILTSAGIPRSQIHAETYY